MKSIDGGGDEQQHPFQNAQGGPPGQEAHAFHILDGAGEQLAGLGLIVEGKESRVSLRWISLRRSKATFWEAVSLNDALEIIEDTLDDGQPEQGQTDQVRTPGWLPSIPVSMIQRMNWGMRVLRPRMIKRVR